MIFREERAKNIKSGDLPTCCCFRVGLRRSNRKFGNKTCVRLYKKPTFTWGCCFFGTLTKLNGLTRGKTARVISLHFKNPYISPLKTPQQFVFQWKILKLGWQIIQLILYMPEFFRFLTPKLTWVITLKVIAIPKKQNRSYFWAKIESLDMM